MNVKQPAASETSAKHFFFYFPFSPPPPFVSRIPFAFFSLPSPSYLRTHNTVLHSSATSRKGSKEELRRKACGPLVFVWTLHQSKLPPSFQPIMINKDHYPFFRRMLSIQNISYGNSSLGMFHGTNFPLVPVIFYKCYIYIICIYIYICYMCFI